MSVTFGAVHLFQMSSRCCMQGWTKCSWDCMVCSIQNAHLGHFCLWDLMCSLVGPLAHWIGCRFRMTDTFRFASSSVHEPQPVCVCGDKNINLSSKCNCDCFILSLHQTLHCAMVIFCTFEWEGLSLVSHLKVPPAGGGLLPMIELTAVSQTHWNFELINASDEVIDRLASELIS